MKLTNEELPFVVIQMHMFGKLGTNREPVSGRVPWAELGEPQLAVAQNVPAVGRAVTYDLGKEQSQHPPDKKSISARAALVARKMDHGEDVLCYRPCYKEMEVEGDKSRLTFENLGGGLTAKGGKHLKYFSIAGADKKYFWADAKIDGDAVVVSRAKVKTPAAVRYAWDSG